MNKVSAVYKIVNTVTNDCYVGSSKNVKQRWKDHKKPSTWKRHPNSPMYQDFQKYGLEKFKFLILAPVMPEYLTQVEQEFIEMIKPKYNGNRANGLDIERRTKYQKKYIKDYRQCDKGKEINRQFSKNYNSQLCSYNGEIVRLGTLAQRFRRAGVEHYTLEAKKFLLANNH